MHRTMDITAREAAHLLECGDAETVAEAISMACHGLDGRAAPTRSLVRRHLESLRQTSMGLEAWQRMRIGRLEAIEELLQTILYLAPEAVVLVSGRAAEGHVDDTSPARVRVIGIEAPLLLDELEAHGLAPAHVTNLATSLGAIPVAHVTGTDLLVDLLFLPDVPDGHGRVNLVNGRPVATCNLDAFCDVVEAARVEVDCRN